MLIHRDALAVHELWAKDAGRYFLDGAMIDKHGRAIATDGHMLVRFTSAPYPEGFNPIDGLDVEASEDSIIAREDLRAALSTMTKNSGVDSKYLAVVPNGSTVTIATSQADRTVRITARKIDGKFPAYEPVLKPKNPVVATVTLGPQLLATLGRIATEVGANSIKFELHGDSAEVMDQIVFTANGTNGTLDGALMPMRP